ncbi:enolase C-terminal domain-like protein [Microlunatus soli]|uniref:Mannonate dehydratase n=1 Tax=Microlunatus soli TaxID=630515 RepID=A0A1H1Z0B5_9ACTN|nr:enolase C-terminal domain-like protein [Microlunatus soli]SDT27184.1 mannonate dehydratase [Microlunatus soli]
MAADPFRNPWPAREPITITGVRAIVTAPEGIPLVVVRIDTDDPELYGLGCATFTQRWQAVRTFIDEHLPPLLVGRYPGDIGDLTRLLNFAGYWRGGPVTNNAISGVDQALWDIAGKRAGLPVHELLGGKVRAAVDTYLHASGRTIEETISSAKSLIDQGQRHVRLQVSTPGTGGYGAPQVSGEYPSAPYPDGWSARDYLRRTPELFAAARAELPDNIELLHDVHSRLTPNDALWLVRALEPYRLFFLEDILAPELWDRLPEIRAAAGTPVAVGELTTSLTDAVRLIRDGGVDFIRCHISDIGGLTPARKLADLAELCGVRTAWHGPGDTSPIGAAANVALDISSPAFGIQEGHVYNEATHQVFPGTLDITDGWLHPNEAPGWGITIDEEAAAAYLPGRSGHDAWAAGVRRPDGALEAP